jgi:hypothetical protein
MRIRGGAIHRHAQQQHALQVCKDAHDHGTERGREIPAMRCVLASPFSIKEKTIFGQKTKDEENQEKNGALSKLTPHIHRTMQDAGLHGIVRSSRSRVESR